MNDSVLAVDLGGTNVRAGIVDREGHISSRAERKTRVESRDEVVASIVEVSRATMSNKNVIAAGVAAPVVFGGPERHATRWPNISVLDGDDLGELLASEFDFPIFLENDATAATIGEHRFGAAKGFDNVIGITLGTGVGGGLIIGGEAYRGRDGSAGEIGHINVEPEGHPCGCGSRGCLEQYASATAIVRLARERSGEFPASRLRLHDDLTSQEVYDAGVKGDDLARVVFDKVGYYLGIALASLINLLDPDVIVIGGGAAGGWDLFIESVHEEVQKRAFQQPAERVKIVRGTLGDDAGLLGAAAVAFANLDKGSR